MLSTNLRNTGIATFHVRDVTIRVFSVDFALKPSGYRLVSRKVCGLRCTLRAERPAHGPAMAVLLRMFWRSV
eukprot:9469463-Pyramimonas_sp.AAC.1